MRKVLDILVIIVLLVNSYFIYNLYVELNSLKEDKEGVVETPENTVEKVVESIELDENQEIRFDRKYVAEYEDYSGTKKTHTIYFFSNGTISYGTHTGTYTYSPKLKTLSIVVYDFNGKNAPFTVNTEDFSKSFVLDGREYKRTNE